MAGVVFHLFVHEGKRQSEIARILNHEQIKTDLGRQWTKKSVEQVLTNEKYIGNDVYNRRSGKLSKHRTAMPLESGSVQPSTDLACRPRMGCS